MRRYLDNAIFWDVLFCIILGTGLFLSRDFIKQHISILSTISIPSSNSIDKLGDCLITIGTTLIGFLLTIITVIVTFKKGFEDKKEDETKGIEKPIDMDQIPTKTIFDKKVSKEKQFYGSDIHKKVADVFLGATYETGLILFILLGIKTDLFSLSNSIVCFLTFIVFIMLTASVVRSFYIFRLFLKAHLHDEKI